MVKDRNLNILLHIMHRHFPVMWLYREHLSSWSSYLSHRLRILNEIQPLDLAIEVTTEYTHVTTDTYTHTHVKMLASENQISIKLKECSPPNLVIPQPREKNTEEWEITGKDAVSEDILYIKKSVMTKWKDSRMGGKNSVAYHKGKIVQNIGRSMRTC